MLSGQDGNYIVMQYAVNALKEEEWAKYRQTDSISIHPSRLSHMSHMFQRAMQRQSGLWSAKPTSVDQSNPDQRVNTVCLETLSLVGIPCLACLNCSSNGSELKSLMPYILSNLNFTIHPYETYTSVSNLPGQLHLDLIISYYQPVWCLHQ